MKKINILLSLLLISSLSFAIEISNTSALQTDGGLDINVETFWLQGFSLLESDFSIENNIINLSICFRDEGTLAFHYEDNDFFIPLTNSGDYTINVNVIVSSQGSTTCDSTVVTDTDSITAEYSSLSTNDFEDQKNNNIKISPNPVSAKVNINFEQVFHGQVYLLDSLGKIIRNFDDFQKKNIVLDISDLNSGIYYIVFKTDNKVFHKKILKK